MTAVYNENTHNCHEFKKMFNKNIKIFLWKRNEIINICYTFNFRQKFLHM